jgi:metal-responsive CopG/Arc/MetJ family transcriptional regulator
MTEKEKRERYSTTLDPGLVEKLKIFAIRQKKRFNEVLEDAIRDYLRKYDKPQK